MTSTTTYDREKFTRLKSERSDIIRKCKSITEKAKVDNRDLTVTENDTIELGLTRIKGLDVDILAQDRAMGAALFGQSSADDDYDGNSDQKFMSLRRPGMKSSLAASFGRALGTPGMKAMLDAGDPYTTIPMDPMVYVLDQAPTSLIEVLPAINRPVAYRYMRQTARAYNAAPVAPGGLKPTSTFGLQPVDGRLHVVAHISEAIDKYVLQDGPSLTQFVQLEMVAGLHQAVEQQLVSGDGLGENLTGLAATSGIQTQAVVGTSSVLTCRSAITKVETLGFTPSWFVMNPLDWEKVETSSLTSGNYVLNSEGSRNGLPVDSATKKLWGVGVTVSLAVPAGTAYLISNGVAQLATDGRVDTEWSSSFDDDFGRNQVRLRVEGRFDLAVTRPLGIVKIALA